MIKGKKVIIVILLSFFISAAILAQNNSSSLGLGRAMPKFYKTEVKNFNGTKTEYKNSRFNGFKVTRACNPHPKAERLKIELPDWKNPGKTRRVDLGVASEVKIEQLLEVTGSEDQGAKRFKTFTVNGVPFVLTYIALNDGSLSEAKVKPVGVISTMDRQGDAYRTLGAAENMNLETLEERFYIYTPLALLRHTKIKVE